MIYVVGFLFSHDHRWVTLIKKNRPEWQAGKFNGVGGKVEVGEAVNDAMVREFYEETGVKTKWTDWKEFALLTGDYGAVYVFKAVSTEYLSAVKTHTDEEVMNILVKHILDPDQPYEIVPNLPVLIRLALMDNVKYATLEY
jgi:8-oxo-dGTP diphosphatase